MHSILASGRPADRRHRRAIAIVVWMMIGVTLACTSNDTLFIQLTATPTAKPSPTPLAVQTHFKKGQQLTFAGAELSVSLPNRPGSLNALDMGKTPCFRDSSVTVLDAAKSEIDPNDPMIYYQIRCVGAIGWVPEYRLTAFARNQKAFVKGNVLLWAQPDQTKGNSSDPRCRTGNSATILEFTTNPQNNADKNLYVQVQCGEYIGYVLEKSLTTSSPDEEF